MDYCCCGCCIFSWLGAVFGWVGSGRVGLDWVGLGWVGLGWVRLSWVGHFQRQSEDAESRRARFLMHVLNRSEGTSIGRFGWVGLDWAGTG